MAKQTVNIGASPDDGTGDTLRAGGQKINANFTELYDGAIGGATASAQLLKDWVAGEAYEVTAATISGTTFLPTTATVKWPDGSAGTFTPTSVNATFNTIDAFTISHAASGKTVTQAAVTRNANGQVTAKPALTVA